MTLTVHNGIEQRSPEWYAARAGIVTASAIGALITERTVKPAANDKSRGLIASLAAERVTGHVEQTFTSDDMWRGIEHEPIARDLYSGHRAEAIECGFMVRDFDGYKIGYSPDGLVGDDGLLEIKCPRQKGHLQTLVADQVPPYYMAQLQTGLLVSGREWIDYVSFCAGMPLWIKRVLPEKRWQDALTEAASQAEEAIAATVAAYEAAATGLPETERITLEIAI